MTTLSVPAPAKLNLFLHVLGRRTDGYHNLQTVFQLLDHGDTLHFEASEDSAITLAPPLPGVAAENNLVLRAAGLLQASEALERLSRVFSRRRRRARRRSNGSRPATPGPTQSDS